MFSTITRERVTFEKLDEDDIEPQKYFFPNFHCTYQFCCPQITYEARELDESSSPLLLGQNLHPMFNATSFFHQKPPVRTDQEANYLLIPMEKLQNINFYIYAQAAGLQKETWSKQIEIKILQKTLQTAVAGLINQAPYFKRPLLQHIFLKLEDGKPGVWLDEYIFPDMADAEGNLPIAMTISGLDSDFVKYEKDPNRLIFSKEEFDLPMIKVARLEIQLEDSQGKRSQKYMLKVEIQKVPPSCSIVPLPELMEGYVLVKAKSICKKKSVIASEKSANLDSCKSQCTTLNSSFKSFAFGRGDFLSPCECVCYEASFKEC